MALKPSFPHALRIEELDENRLDLVQDLNDRRVPLTQQNIIALLPLPPQDNQGDDYHLLALVHREKRRFGLINKRVLKPSKTFIRRHYLEHCPAHLALCRGPFSPMKLHVIISTKSGQCQAEAFFRDVLRPLLDVFGLPNGEQYHVLSTTSEFSIREFASGTLRPRADSGKAQLVLILSGDGGITELVNGLTNPLPDYSATTVKPTIGLSFGTANALANSSGLRSDGTFGLSSFLRGKPRSLPTFLARFSPGSEMLLDTGRRRKPLQTDADSSGVLRGAVFASWGLHASLVANSDTVASRNYGPECLGMAAKLLIEPVDGSPPHVYRGNVTSFNRDARFFSMQKTPWRRTEYVYLVAMLVSNLEATLKISPDSKPMDGRIRVVHFGPLPSDRVTEIFELAKDGGKHIWDPEVGYESVGGLHIDLEEPDPTYRRVCVDGKIVRVPDGGWAKVERDERDIVDLVVPEHI